MLSSRFESEVRADEVSRETLPSAPRMRPNEPYTCCAITRAIIVKHMRHVRCREKFRGLLAEAKTGKNLSQQIVRRDLPSQLR